MFQHTGRHIKRRPTCCPETEGVTPRPNKTKFYRHKWRGFNRKGILIMNEFIKIDKQIVLKDLGNKNER